jgi:selenocysteine lyase/cysteine desulfurase
VKSRAAARAITSAGTSRVWAATARASFGIYTTEAEIDRLVDGLHDARTVFRV